MSEYIAPLLLFIVLFVGFGLSQRGQKSAGGCGSCTGGSCTGKSECSSKQGSESKPHTGLGDYEPGSESKPHTP